MGKCGSASSCGMCFSLFLSNQMSLFIMRRSSSLGESERLELKHDSRLSHGSKRWNSSLISFKCECQVSMWLHSSRQALQVNVHFWNYVYVKKMSIWWILKLVFFPKKDVLKLVSQMSYDLAMRYFFCFTNLYFFLKMPSCRKVNRWTDM